MSTVFVCPKVLALDLEGTLISNAMSQIPRPGLYDFLERCRALFPRVVMFTTVQEPRFRSIACALVERGYSPPWFSEIEYVHWAGETKDLRFVAGASPSDIYLLDDFEKYIHPGQEAQWLKIDYFDYPYDSSDTGLQKVLTQMEEKARQGLVVDAFEKSIEEFDSLYRELAK